MGNELYSPRMQLGQPGGLAFLNQRKNEDIQAPLLPRLPFSSGEGGSVLGNLSSPPGLNNFSRAEKLRGGVWERPRPQFCPRPQHLRIWQCPYVLLAQPLLHGMAEYGHVPSSYNSAFGSIQTIPRILIRNIFPIRCTLIASNRRENIIMDTPFQLFLHICAQSYSEGRDLQAVPSSRE